MRFADVSASGLSLNDWKDSIDSLGTERFGEVLLRSLERWADVDLCAAINLEGKEAKVLFADPALDLTCGSTHRALPPVAMDDELWVARLDATSLSRLSRHGIVSDCLLVRGRRESRAYGLVLARTADRNTFSEMELDCIRAVSGTWLSLLAKHQRMLRTDDEDDPSMALLADDVPQLEAKVLRHMPALSRREAQVCARILRGMSTPGIAVDLNVQDDSVATYRKRAYRRLAIGTRLELIRHFIACCTSRAETFN